MFNQTGAQVQSRQNARFEVLGALGLALVVVTGLAAAGLAIFYSLLINLDRQGPFHNRASAADLDGDGDLDISLMNLRYESETAIWHQLTLWTNQGNGRFTSQLFQTPPVGYLAAATGDVDRDGDADLVLLRSDQLEFYLNQGEAQEGESGQFRLGGSTRPDGGTGTPGSIVLGDLNGDGELDGFVAGCCGMYLPGHDGNSDLDIAPVSWAWLNGRASDGRLGNETLGYPELKGLRIREAALGDLNGDGTLDVLAAALRPKPGKPGNPALLALLNDGAGRLSQSVQRLVEGESTAVALGDVNGDGSVDALVGSESGAVLWLNQGGQPGGVLGEFAAAEAAFGSDPVRVVFLEDLDGDGDLDALIGGKRQASAWLNDGQGSFKRTSQRFSYSERHALAVGDFNDDRYPDIFAGAYSENYRVWLNRGNGTFR